MTRCTRFPGTGQSAETAFSCQTNPHFLCKLVGHHSCDCKCWCVLCNCMFSLSRNQARLSPQTITLMHLASAPATSDESELHVASCRQDCRLTREHCNKQKPCSDLAFPIVRLAHWCLCSNHPNLAGQDGRALNIPIWLSRRHLLLGEATVARTSNSA